MNFDKILRIGLLLATFAVALLGLLFFGRLPFLMAMVLLAALVELGFGRYHDYADSGRGNLR